MLVYYLTSVYAFSVDNYSDWSCRDYEILIILSYSSSTSVYFGAMRSLQWNWWVQFRHRSVGGAGWVICGFNPTPMIGGCMSDRSSGLVLSIDSTVYNSTWLMDRQQLFQIPSPSPWCQINFRQFISHCHVHFIVLQFGIRITGKYYVIFLSNFLP